MIHRLCHMIGSAQCSTLHPEMGYVRAVPAPFYGGLLDRLRDAAAVVRGGAFAVRWPQDGELELAMPECFRRGEATIEAENARLRHVAQSRYELLRECQSEFRASGSKGLVETIEATLARSDPA